MKKAKRRYIKRLSVDMGGIKLPYEEMDFKISDDVRGRDV